MSYMEINGTVLQGINRIYRVLSDSSVVFECRIKGKVLDQVEVHYNPLSAGDRVVFTEDLNNTGKGMILRRVERKNAFVRYNHKRNAPQIIAANFDLVVCVTSPQSPPFRPRFIDRVAVSVPDNAQLLIVMNKMDQGINAEDEARLDYYEKMGYLVVRCSAETGEGIDTLLAQLKDNHSVFVGQSGVGKSTLLNRIRPDISQKIGELSEKYNRGRHTTNFSVLFPSSDYPVLTDTPGIREIDVYGIEPEDLYHYYRDLDHYQGQCSFNKCLHQNEPDCAVIAALEKGEINEDRYISYLNLLQDLLIRRKKDEYR